MQSMNEIIVENQRGQRIRFIDYSLDGEDAGYDVEDVPAGGTVRSSFLDFNCHGRVDFL